MSIRTHKWHPEPQWKPPLPWERRSPRKGPPRVTLDNLKAPGYLSALFSGSVEKKPGSVEKSPRRRYHDGGPGRVDSAGDRARQSVRFVENGRVFLDCRGRVVA